MVLFSENNSYLKKFMLYVTVVDNHIKKEVMESVSRLIFVHRPL